MNSKIQRARKNYEQNLLQIQNPEHPLQFPKLLSHLFYIIFLPAILQNKQIIASQSAMQPARACKCKCCVAGFEAEWKWRSANCECYLLFSRKTKNTVHKGGVVPTRQLNGEEVGVEAVDEEEKRGSLKGEVRTKLSWIGGVWCGVAAGIEGGKWRSVERCPPCWSSC